MVPSISVGSKSLMCMYAFRVSPHQKLLVLKLNERLAIYLLGFVDLSVFNRCGGSEKVDVPLSTAINVDAFAGLRC